MSEATDTKRGGVVKLSSAKDKLKEKERKENLAKLEQWKVSQYLSNTNICNVLLQKEQQTRQLEREQKILQEEREKAQLRKKEKERQVFVFSL